METKNTSKRSIISYIVVCISEFADNKGIDNFIAYKYLSDFGGIEFLIEFYEIEHTLSFKDAVEDMTIICKKNGGDIE